MLWWLIKVFYSFYSVLRGEVPSEDVSDYFSNFIRENWVERIKHTSISCILNEFSTIILSATNITKTINILHIHGDFRQFMLCNITEISMTILIFVQLNLNLASGLRKLYKIHPHSLLFLLWYSSRAKYQARLILIRNGSVQLKFLIHATFFARVDWTIT